jgi:hypothetical protein
MRALSGYWRRIGAETAIFSVVYQSSGSPRLASATAGAAISASGSRPQRRCISS